MSHTGEDNVLSQGHDMWQPFVNYVDSLTIVAKNVKLSTPLFFLSYSFPSLF